MWSVLHDFSLPEGVGLRKVCGGGIVSGDLAEFSGAYV